MSRKRAPRELIVRADETVFMVPFEKDGVQYTRYFIDDGDSEEMDDGSDAELEEMMSLFGAWSDLDWDEMADELDRIRHESKPTPPIEL